MNIFKKCCYGVASALIVILAGLASSGIDAVYAQGWLVVIAVVLAITGVIIEIDQHLFPAQVAGVDVAAPPTPTPTKGTSPVRQSTPLVRSGMRVAAPGVTRHGRMRASLNLRTGEHQVMWAGNMKVVGSLVPGAKDGWDVYDAEDEVLGWAPDVRAGMALLEETSD